MTALQTFAKFRIAWLMAAAMLLGSLIAPAVVHGQDITCDTATDPFCIDVIAEPSGLGDQELQVTVASIINVALSLLGIVAVVIILIGGFKWLTSGGSDEKVAEARKLIFAGVIGLAIILSAFAIARFVIDSLSVATGTGIAGE